MWSGCCASAVAKGRKLCCKCGGAHNANESHVGRQQDDFSAAILTDGGGSSSKDAVAEGVPLSKSTAPVPSYPPPLFLFPFLFLFVPTL